MHRQNISTCQRPNSSAVPSALELGAVPSASVSVSTVQKWIRENDKAMQTMTWLKYKLCENDANHMAILSCSVCQQFDDKLRGMRNYSVAFVTGATNLRSSSFKDHGRTDMHCKAILLYHRKTSSLNMPQFPELFAK